MERIIFSLIAVMTAISMSVFSNTSKDLTLLDSPVMYYNVNGDGTVRKTISEAMSCGQPSYYRCSYIFQNPNNIPPSTLPEIIDMDSQSLGTTTPIGPYAVNE